MSSNSKQEPKEGAKTEISVTVAHKSTMPVDVPKEKLAVMLDEHWNSLGFGGKCLSILSGALSSVVSVPVNVFSGAVAVVKDTGSELVGTIETIPDALANGYNEGLKAIAETGGLHPGSMNWDEEYKKLGWGRRALAFTVGCLSAVIGFPIHLLKGVIRTGIRLVTGILALPFQVIAGAMSSYNKGSVDAMYYMSKSEHTVEFFDELGKVQNEKSRIILGMDQDGLDSLKVKLASRIDKAINSAVAAAA